jgi:hypothetical protein
MREAGSRPTARYAHWIAMYGVKALQVAVDAVLAAS